MSRWLRAAGVSTEVQKGHKGQKGQKPPIGTQTRLLSPFVPSVPYVLTSKELTPDQRDAFEERAAIIEFDSRPKAEPTVPRDEAEQRATADILELKPCFCHLLSLLSLMDLRRNISLRTPTHSRNALPSFTKPTPSPSMMTARRCPSRSSRSPKSRPKHWPRRNRALTMPTAFTANWSSAGRQK